MAEGSGLTRRTWLRRAGLGSVALASGVRKLCAQPARKPNIVFILADDMGYADVSCYGRPDLHTPNIDGLATRGVRFLQAYANSAVCTATRAGLITGRYQDRLRVGLEEPLGTEHRPSDCHLTTPPCRRCCARPAMALRWLGSGTSAPYRTLVR